MRCSILCLAIVWSVCSFLNTPTACFAKNWPQFRGGQFDAVVDAAIPENWSAEKNVKWKHANPGEGWSAPVVWGNRLYLTAAEQIAPPTKTDVEDENPRRSGRSRYQLVTAKYRWLVYCLDADTGKELWRTTVREGNPTLPRHSTNSYATETPITDGKFVYAYFGMTGLYCLDLEGNVVWSKDLGTYKMRAGWGTSSSPVLFDDRLFFQIDNDEQSFVAALNAADGSEIWRQNRNEPSQYSSPIVWQNSVRNELITVGQFTRSYDLATGALLWELDMLKGRSSATPIAVGDMLYVGNEFRNRGGSDDGGGFMFAVRAGASGDITPEPEATSSPDIAWITEKAGLQMASPVYCEGYLYLLERRSGVLHCLDAMTGEKVYKTRVAGAQAFWSSPWVSGSNVYCLDDDGNTHVIPAGPEFAVTTVNSIPEQFWATPGFGNNAIYLRGAKYLYCIAE